MESINQVMSSGISILTCGGVGAGVGAAACSTAAIIGAATPPVAAGAVAMGTFFGIQRTVYVIQQKIYSHNVFREISVPSRFLLQLCSIQASLHIAAIAAAQLGLPITFKATALLGLACTPCMVGIAAVATIAAAIYIKERGVPAFARKTLDETVRDQLLPERLRFMLLRAQLDNAYLRLQRI